MAEARASVYKKFEAKARLTEISVNDMTKEYFYDNDLTNCRNVFINVIYYIFIKLVGDIWESIGLMPCI